MLLNGGNIEDAIAELLAVVQQEPERPSARLLLAQAMEYTGDLDGARAMYLELVRLEPGMIPALINHGALLERFGDLVEAERVYREGLSHHPDDVACALNLARLLGIRGALEEARQILAVLLERIPGQPEALALIGWVFLLGGHLDLARAYLDAAQMAGIDNPQWRACWEAVSVR
jgi:Flp pilus assembly protein TadD